MSGRTFRRAFHIAKSLDVSPLSPGGLSKEAIILFWGINAVIFLANGFDQSHLDTHSDGSVFCTVIKKFEKSDLFTQDTQIVHFSEYIIISSYHSELPHFDVEVTAKERSPPHT